MSDVDVDFRTKGKPFYFSKNQLIFRSAIIEAAAKNQFKDEESYEDYINQQVTKVLRHNNYKKMQEMSMVAKNAKIHCAVLGKCQKIGFPEK